MYASAYPTYPIFNPHTLNVLLHFGQTVHQKKKLEGKACMLKDFFYDMNPIALRKAKWYTILAFLSAVGLKEEKLFFQRT